MTETYLWIAAALVALAAILFFIFRRGDPKAGTVSPAEEPRTSHPPADSEPVETAPPVAAAGDGPFLSAPDGEPDNLRQIKGIGPKLAERLHELGVYHFRQIADWTPDQLATVDAQLGKFAGRPERDQWQAQARLLADGDIKTYEKLHGKLLPDGN